MERTDTTEKKIFELCGADITKFMQKACSKRYSEEYKKNLRVSMDYHQEVKKLPAPIAFLPAAKLGSLSITAPEIMFTPSVFDQHYANTPGIVNATHTLIMSCDMDKQTALWKHVILSGGTAQTSGFESRFDQDMKTIFPEFPGVTHTDDKDNLIAKGSSIFASLSDFRKKCTANEELGKEKIRQNVVNPSKKKPDEVFFGVKLTAALGKLFSPKT